MLFFTLTISIGWMTQVASIPDAPPLANGFTIPHTPAAADALFGFESPISPILINENLQREQKVKGTSATEGGGKAVSWTEISSRKFDEALLFQRYLRLDH